MENYYGTPLTGIPIFAFNVIGYELVASAAVGGIITGALSGTKFLAHKNPGKGVLEGTAAGVGLYALSFFFTYLVTKAAGYAKIGYRTQNLINRPISILAATLIGAKILGVPIVTGLIVASPLLLTAVVTSIKLYFYLHKAKAKPDDKPAGA